MPKKREEVKPAVRHAWGEEPPAQEVSPEERSRKQKLKDFAHDKTPEKLKNPTDIQVRFRTGFVYIAVSVVCIMVNEWTTLLLLMLTAGISAGEFYYMLRSDAKLPNEMLGIIGAVLYPASVFFLGMDGVVYVSLALLVALIAWYVFWMRARVADVGVSFFGAAYTGLLLSGLVVVRSALPDPWGGLLVLGIFLSVWANDSFAYLFGRKFGKHKLAPRTSPKKSWEGFFAGLVASMLFWALLSFIPGVSMSIPLALLFGLVCGLAGVLGDLAESRIKRNSGFKDSGTIMPGHGGLLDRCDSLFLVAITSAVLLVAGGCIPYAG
ncbi:MAG TPA: phosphatidate cytidylyltransferase [Candidatus Aphodovivens avistercoris]|nr:phosphatidate cytidylyltransferase [Candidatus Aphodovivens avistercoris]